MKPDVAAIPHGAGEPIAPIIVAADAGDPLAVQHLRADIIGHGSVPSAPSVLLEIIGTDDDGDLHGLLRAIERDPGLTSKILRTANSSFFGQSRTVATIDRAMLVVGAAMVRSIAVSVAVFEAIGDKLAIDEVERVWRHSLATAMVARRLAARVGCRDLGQVLSAAVLHESGRMLLARRFPHFYASLPSQDALAVIAAERATIGVDHATVGGWLFEAWQLPPAIVAAVAQHHAALPAPGLPSIIAAANLVTSYPDANILRDEDGDARARAAAAEFDLTPESWSDLAAALGDAAATTASAAP